jgi:hypothetical protein
MMDIGKSIHLLLAENWSIGLFACQIPGQEQQQGI